MRDLTTTLHGARSDLTTLRGRNRRSVRVAIVASALPLGHNGGAERQALRLALELGGRGNEVWLFTGGPRAQQRRLAPGVTSVEWGRPRGAWVATTGPSPVRLAWGLVRGLDDLLRFRRHFDVMLALQTVLPGVVGAVAAAVLRKPVIVWIRGEGEYRDDQSVRGRVLAPFAWRRATAVLVQTTAIRHDFKRALGGLMPSAEAARVGAAVRVIGNGVDVPDQQPTRATGRRLLFVGRLVAVKGIRYLIEAMDDIPSSHLTIVGEGADRAALEALADRRPVTFRGSLEPSDLARLYDAAAMVVLPSTFGEGLPNVVLEAMSHGRTVVATRIAGLEDVVRDGQTGLLVEPGNAAALATAISSLLNTPDRLSRFGQAAYEAVQEYRWEAIAAAVEALLCESVHTEFQ